jgi:cytochrome c-type biogenesis protein CcmF
VTVTILQEFVRGARVRQTSTGTDLFTALIGLFARSKRRYGGYVVHLGIVVVFLGFAGGAFEREEQVELSQRQQVEVAPYTVQFLALHVTRDSQKEMITAEVSIARDGENYGRLYPARWFYDKRPDEPTTEVAIRRGFAEDLYIVLAGYDASDQSAILMVQVNPLLNWIWVGIGIMILGTGIALLPERAFAFATSKVPEGAVTTSLILLMVLVAGVGRAHAQHAADPDVVIVPATTRLEKELQHQIVCMCGTCGRQRIGECTCPRAAEQRKELAALVAAGNTYDQIIDHFVTEWGSQQVLAAPIDEGFNRLAWALPYMVGLIGIVVVGGVAVRWSRRGPAAADGPAVPVNPALESKLDDELRDLD